MDSAGANGANGSGSGGRFEGYSHYQTVSSSIAESIDEAIAAYAELDSLHAEGGKVSTQQAAHARSRIKRAALKLVPELRGDAPKNEQYQQMLARWLGSIEIEQDDGTPKFVQPQFPHPGPDDGYFAGLKEIKLQQTCPDWVEDWIIDIRTAGWEIGYLQAGRSVSPEPDVPDADKEFEEMFADK